MKVELNITKLNDYIQFIGNPLFELSKLELEFNMNKMSKIDFIKLLDILDRIDIKSNKDLYPLKSNLNNINLGTVQTFMKQYFNITDKISRKMVRGFYEMMYRIGLIYSGYNYINRTERGKSISKFVNGYIMWNMIELENILLSNGISRSFTSI